MNQSQEMSSESKEELRDEVNESLGNPELTSNSAEENPREPENDELPEYAKKRIGMQEKRHKKEIRRMQQQLDELHSRLNRSEPQNSNEHSMNNYSSSPEVNEMNKHIYSAVQQAMKIKEEEEKKQENMQRAHHIYSKEKDLRNHLDKYSDKYEDFDDVVMSQDAPYTDSIKAMSMVMHDIPGVNIPETLYRLGKDKDKLREISKLQPLDQAKEVVKLAIALMNGNGKPNQSDSYKPLGQIKSNPVTSQPINKNTSISELRRRMKEGYK